ncbi:uncharacterized protein [Nicotiana sylvestris]|uniref:Uncharacterized protein LOC104244339 n=1 Tax=Nicotiana sylvestris TaxID=4096 RepID=A0A1U7Y1M6_NICSY|nr:PREDICTED: uncharacterized protein LOC104244339 [Nicotiana sylvestris]
MAHPSDLPPLHPPAPPDPSNGDWTTNLPEPILSNQPPSNNASTATLDQTNTISSIGNEDAGINTYTNNQNKQYLLPNPTYSAPSQLKISSNFDRPQHRKEQISDKTIVDHQKPPHITGTQPISPPNTQTLVPSKMEMVILTNTFNRGNRQHDPPSNKRNDQVVSKPSFAATVQAQLSASSGAPLVNIEYGTHLDVGCCYCCVRWFLDLKVYIHPCCSCPLFKVLLIVVVASEPYTNCWIFQDSSGLKAYAKGTSVLEG